MRPPLIILAGGKGTRLGKLTKDVPKPMVDVYGKPFLYWLISYYISQGFADIIVSTGYKQEVIESYPWPWPLKFWPDSEYGLTAIWGLETPCWIVNGDTWITDRLPDEDGQIVMHSFGVDAGAHFLGWPRKTKLIETTFIDIGTPRGLDYFKGYFSTHLANK